MFIVDKIHKRIAHIVHGHAVRPIKIHLERQNGKYSADMLFKKGNAPRSPGPYFRGDEVVHGNMQTPGDLRHPEIEFRRIHQQHGVRLLLLHRPPYAPEYAGNPGKNSQNFHHAHDGEFLNAEDIALPGLFEPVPSHADGFKGQVAAVAFKTQGMKQFRSLNVARKVLRR